MSTEEEIRHGLIEACKTRGKQAEIAKALDVHQSTVARWMLGGEIGSTASKLLDWYLFGIVPPRIKNISAQHVLHFSDDEWAIISAMARREGTTEEHWIAGRIRGYLAFQNKSVHLAVKDPPESEEGNVRNG